MCEQKATSKEHVPPKCFFPKSQDTSGSKDYRKNLITVPSCDKHNSQKSQDDEYLRMLVTNICSGNKEADLLLDKSIKQSLLRNAKLMGLLKKPYIDQQIGTIAFQVDRQRFDDALSRLFFALFYHHTSGEKWLKHVKIVTPALLPRIESKDKSKIDVRNKYYWYGERRDKFITSALLTLPKLGNNPEIFHYKFAIQSLDSGQKTFVARMVFFETLPIAGCAV